MGYGRMKALTVALFCDGPGGRQPRSYRRWDTAISLSPPCSVGGMFDKDVAGRIDNSYIMTSYSCTEILSCQSIRNKLQYDQLVEYR